MPGVNWSAFAALPGAADLNFEMLCRALVRRHYAAFGEFIALANQPGVEFHLKLHSACSLGEAGRWYGWQCRWYDLPSGRAIGTTRRRKIEEALSTSVTLLPGLTDWVLWTRHPLTEGDQEWFRGQQSHMRLHLWTAAEVEEHLSGPAAILRSTYFGELVLTPQALDELHVASVAPIRRRWQPEVHQVLDAERVLRCALGSASAWSELRILATRLDSDVSSLTAELAAVREPLRQKALTLANDARTTSDLLRQTYAALQNGSYESLKSELPNPVRVDPAWGTVLRWLRATRQPAALTATNLLADVRGSRDVLDDLSADLHSTLIAILADAGCGKTELAAQLTAADDERPSGVLLHGRDLHAGGNLDDLARRVVINGFPVPSFEALLAAVDAAGERAGRRLPIVVDGLNEAEDPRDWKAPLASAEAMLDRFPHVLLVCTLRSPFASEALPENLETLEISGFEQYTHEAIQRYFQYYRIDPSDADLPLWLLRHPLTLRLFCEVTNPDRKEMVGVEAMPMSLSALFDRYLEQVAERVSQLAPRTRRYYTADVHAALSEIGAALWSEHARSLELSSIRRRLGDEARPWNESIVRALEHDGVIFREPGERPGSGRISILYDALAGHIVADSLIGLHAGQGFATWLNEAENIRQLTGELSELHPLATDVFRALAGLLPRRMYGQQLWALLDAEPRKEAIRQAALLEGRFLDQSTVSELGSLAVETPTGPGDLFDRLWITRAARSHPLDAEFLDSILRPLAIPERDLRWTEWVRRRQKEIIDDLQSLEHRWRAEEILRPGDLLRARWLIWTLTSTVRRLRDHATRSLYWLGCADAQALFALTTDSLSINDSYVPERLLAACYGISMSLWADPRGESLRMALPSFANVLIAQMFVPGAPWPTRHALMRDYALGVISVARLINPDCVPDDKRAFLTPPFHHIPSPFPPVDVIEDSELESAKEAIRMDFGNYTIGGLVSGRHNYDFRHAEYANVLRQIKHRILALGYSPDRFSAIDGRMGEDEWRTGYRSESKTDRYGKKYSWIAFFEMYGLRQDQGSLPEWRDRPSDADIDPSFPERARTWQPPLPDLFAFAPSEPRDWLVDGPTPDYAHLLSPDEVDGEQGPWVMLEGFVEQVAAKDDRQIFTFLRGLLVDEDRLPELLREFESIEYPGNMALPEPYGDHYTYAGEIPWSARFGAALRTRNGRAKRDRREAFHHHDGTRWVAGIPVEVPAFDFSWESYHSSLNQVSGTSVPAPAICERLNLTNRRGEWDLYDRRGRVASLYREFNRDQGVHRSHLLYLRADLMAKYLARTHQKLVWLCWGEREFHHRVQLAVVEGLRDVYSEHKEIHRQAVICTL